MWHDLANRDTPLKCSESRDANLFMCSGAQTADWSIGPSRWSYFRMYIHITRGDTLFWWKVKHAVHIKSLMNTRWYWNKTSLNYQQINNNALINSSLAWLGKFNICHELHVVPRWGLWHVLKKTGMRVFSFLTDFRFFGLLGSFL